MRSALLFVLFAIFTNKSASRAAPDDEFRPTPIPLWSFEERDARAASLYETEAPAALMPAHYWEDALRHSVYLTLVRDNIDKLIAQGDVISPNSKPDLDSSKKVDDHDLWDRIKSAPFERIETEESASFGDVTIVSKGRLMEDRGNFKFTEDEVGKDKCDKQSCKDGVKAYWSVKRMKQTDGNASSGRYHYELTFAVMTQTQKKHKKPYENPTRTFTVRESTPEKVVDQPLEHRTYELVTQATRPERTLWFHKNIYPTQRYQARQHQTGLDRLFTSLFSDDDDDYTVIQRYKPKQTYVPQTYSQFNSKIAYVGASSETYQQQQQQQQQQKKLAPYAYKPQYPIKYSRPPMPPPQPPIPHPHHYLDTDSIGVVSAPYVAPPYPENNIKYHYSSKAKPRPPIMLGPVQPYPVKKVNVTSETTTLVEEAPITTKGPEIVTAYIPEDSDNLWPSDTLTPQVSEKPEQSSYNKPEEESKPWASASNERPPTTSYEYEQPQDNVRPRPSSPHGSERPPPQSYNKPKPGHIKVSYFQEHVRPPVYNAPPGIFVTMDKKPFKPMPPLRIHSSKPYKNHRPIDFRPSPQVLDTTQLSEPDQLKDVFRPITVNYNIENATATTEKVEIISTVKPVVEKVLRKSNSTGHHHRKPSKKHEHKKSQHTTLFLSSTPVPEIITASQSSSEEAHDSIHWANLLGAFSKTTPMASQTTEETKKLDNTTPAATSTTLKLTTRRTTTTTTTENPPETTQAPAKRTRPPPKFTKPINKIKKHKRVTTTTTKAPGKFTPKRPLQDLTPQASSAAASKSSTKWSPSYTTQTLTTTTNKPTTTSTKATTTTELVTSAPETPAPTEKPKNKNRYRQSTLMQKGTSVKHDKWSVMGSDFVPKTKTILPHTSGNFPPRRKGSNFQGYVSSTGKPNDDDEEEEYEEIPNPSITPKLSSTTEAIIRAEKLEVVSLPKTTQSTYEKHEAVSEDQDSQESNESAEEDFDNEQSEEEDDENDEVENKDRREFMFYPKATTQTSDRTNEIGNSEEASTTEQIVVASPHSVSKNKTKCKKKLSTTTEAYEAYEKTILNNTEPEADAASTMTEKPSTTDIFDELFGGFTFDEPQETTQVETKVTAEPASDHEEAESENHERYVKTDEGQDFEDFLDELEEKHEESKKEESFYSEEEKDKSDDYSDEDEKAESARDTDSYEEIEEQSPFSLFELMAME